MRSIPVSPARVNFSAGRAPRKAHFSFHVCNDRPFSFCHRKMDPRLVVRDPRNVTCLGCLRVLGQLERTLGAGRGALGNGPLWWIKPQLECWDKHCRALGAPDPRTEEYRGWKRREHMRIFVDSVRWATGGPIGVRCRRDLRELVRGMLKSDRQRMSPLLAKLKPLYRQADELAARFSAIADQVERAATRRVEVLDGGARHG